MYVNTISYVPIWSVSTDPPFPDVLGSTPLTFVTPTPFTVILNKSIAISSDILVPIKIVAVEAAGDELGHGVGSGVTLGVTLGVAVGVGVTGGVLGGVTLGVAVGVAVTGGVLGGVTLGVDVGVTLGVGEGAKLGQYTIPLIVVKFEP